MVYYPNPSPENLEPYADLSDEDVVTLAQADNQEAMDAIISRYKNFVRSRARSYFLIGADKEDIIQEGMIGLYKAIRDYKPDKQSTFHGFADLCVTRQIITAIKSATRYKHVPLNSYVSLNKPMVDEDSDRTLLETLTASNSMNPEELMITAERRRNLEHLIHELLSDLEREVLAGYLDEKSYQEIAGEVKRHVKSVDNALMRIKRKLEKHLGEDGEPHEQE